MFLNSDYVCENLEICYKLSQELKKLVASKNLFFENHPLKLGAAKNYYVEAKKLILLRKFEKFDVDTQIPDYLQAQFLYMKGRCYNVSATYDDRATQCLTQAVKLNPRLVGAWNELGECYWKCMNIDNAKACFETALEQRRNTTSLRSLSTIFRQESTGKESAVSKACVLKSVALAKEATTLDIKDGLSWTALGNAYLYQFFVVDNNPMTLKMCMSAYRQAYLDPVARGQADLFYNKGFAQKYEERYDEALENFDHACRLDPYWVIPQIDLNLLRQYLTNANDLVKTRGKIRAKKLMQMVQSIDKKMLGEYGPFKVQTFGERYNVILEYARINELQEGTNEGKVIIGKVVGSIHNDNCVPFTIAMVDERMECVCVTIYNLASGCGPKIGDCVTIPEPRIRSHRHDSPLATYEFKSIRVNNPLVLLVNGKNVGHDYYSCLEVISSYEASLQRDGWEHGRRGGQMSSP